MGIYSLNIWVWVVVLHNTVIQRIVYMTISLFIHSVQFLRFLTQYHARWDNDKRTLGDSQLANNISHINRYTCIPFVIHNLYWCSVSTHTYTRGKNKDKSVLTNWRKVVERREKKKRSYCKPWQSHESIHEQSHAYWANADKQLHASMKATPEPLHIHKSCKMNFSINQQRRNSKPKRDNEWI